jgi:GWxTD domain-containing protein
LEKWFHSYWKNIDPTQETTYNEIQHVFYRRVSEAVRDYSTRFKEGWQTDLGMVWILYGEPTQIENRKYSVNNTPHIIWKYDFEDNKYEFTFVDKENNGNFILVEPESEQNN